MGLAYAKDSYFYLKDAVGSVVDVLNSGGTRVQHYTYSSFGKIVNVQSMVGGVTQPVSTAFTFTGRELDQESGLLYYRARYYDSNLGRFLQKDPDPGALQFPVSVTNSYVYVGNNPISYTDPSGKIFPLLAAIAIGAVIGGIANVAIHDWQWGQGGANFFKGAAIGAALGAAVYGVAAVIGAGFGAAGLGTGVTAGAETTAAGGAFMGLLAPSTAAYVTATALAIPAGIGLLSPNAPEWMKSYGKGYMIAGAVGNLARAGAMAGFHSYVGELGSIDIPPVGGYGEFGSLSLDSAWNGEVVERLGAGIGSLIPLGL